MSYLELIIPFGIPPAPIAKDLLKELRAPGLAKLLARAGKPRLQAIDAFSRALSHEYWLSGQFPPENQANSPATAWNQMQASQQLPEAGYWFCLQPVHIHIARDHLVLTDQRRLEISEEEAKALFEQAEACCAEIGLLLVYGDSRTWYLRADQWAGLKTATVDAACGHNIDIWLPKGEHERDWRKLQNEIQMLWFTSDINAAREARGAKVINSVWISGGANGLHTTNKPLITASSLKTALARSDNTKQHSIVLLDDLSEAAINNDWALWLEQFQELENHWFTPLLSAFKSGQITGLNLIFSDAHKLATFDITPWSLRKFWLKPSLHHLFSIS